MREKMIRGVSLHTAGDSLLYYIHFDHKTLEVTEKEFDKAMTDLKVSKHPLTIIDRN
ncbi:hypothetical protein J7I80_14615 [Bacillus sp. ISL-41]|uniref:hypothetical protein n=1 Tax=unclassified Bacillus (in: firmicutes) TaxID=185979 RepID=UPI001BEB626E|nr:MULTISPECIES: hypothetical protein [unclassified Bacillus (in: firmicutes)]MBT2640068.1 hypothetical protein [Bacillus sp. ISL-39]MBT2643472.1 hypothetical protein [Bacillus sp. ISL-41]